MNLGDTIAAVATGNVISAIGIVRISGANAMTAADNIFRASSGICLCDAKDRQMYHGELTDACGELIDVCLCTVSRAPKSYTGEDTVEFHCHGSPAVYCAVLQTLFTHGVRQAEAGEFTKRAFLNGRMDLTQAEAVIDLIEAETLFGAKNAAYQLNGAVGTKINKIYDRFVDIMAHFHAVIDYPDEDIDEFDIAKYRDILDGCREELRRMLDTYERGMLLRGGIPTAIAGRTNTGKSSLLNALLGFERAIVTDIPGTTRDTIEEKVLAGNVLLRLIDTAGLRKTDDIVEKLGMERTLSALGGAGLILVVLDGSEPLQKEDYEVLEAVRTRADDAHVIVVINKADLPVADDFAKMVTKTGFSELFPISVSAKTGEGLDKLIAEVQGLFPYPDTAAPGEIITSVRQADAISRAVHSLELAHSALTDKVSPDAVLIDIEAALSAIGEVTGKVMREDIVSRIFERFCVGK